jgi:predicted transcriptional regulator
MSKQRSPTEAELSILQVLWARGPCSVRQVLEQVSNDRNWGYTTVLKLLQIMNEKGLVSRDASGHSHIFQASSSKQATQKLFLGQLINRLFGDSSKQLIIRALTEHESSPEELAEIRNILDELAAKND